MAKRFLTPLNLPNLASNPSTGSEGDLYFNTVDNVIKIYIDGDWVDLQGSASAGNFVIYQDEQPDITNLPAGTIWVDSDAVVGTSGGGTGGVGLNNWTENENGDLIPNLPNIQNIGSEEYPVNEIYVSGSTIYIGNTSLSVDESGDLLIGSYKVITEENANENLDLINYLTISTASTTYATKQELEEIDLTQTINTASAAAFASASAYTDEQLSLIDLTETINTASAAAFGSASAYTNEAINDLIGGAPETLDTLQEIATALNDNPEVLDLFLTKSSASATYATKEELELFSSEEFLIKSESYIAEVGDVVFVNSASGSYTITLPLLPTLGDKVRVVDLSKNAEINNITILRNGSNINGEPSNFVIDINNAGVELIYTNNIYGWRTLND
jgi:predicted RNA-binding protein Jag